MDQPSESNRPSKSYLNKEYEDPHFHDDDLETAEERERRAAQSPRPKAAKRLPPPPRRRFAED